MNSKAPQYFGVAGTTTEDEVGRLLGFLDLIDLPDGVRFMNGPLISYKTLNGQSSASARYPSIGILSDLLLRDPRVLNIIHYNSKYPDLFDQLLRLMSISPYIHGIQLNIANPELVSLERFKYAYPDALIVLQLGSGVFESCSSDVGRLIQYVRKYEEVVDYALLDLSGGEGEPFRMSIADNFLLQMIIENMSVMAGVTGGLKADNVLRLNSLLARDRSLCWDAESGLRTDDVLDLGKCFGFCAASATLLR